MFLRNKNEYGRKAIYIPIFYEIFKLTQTISLAAVEESNKIISGFSGKPVPNLLRLEHGQTGLLYHFL